MTDKKTDLDDELLDDEEDKEEEDDTEEVETPEESEKTEEKESLDDNEDELEEPEETDDTDDVDTDETELKDSDHDYEGGYKIGYYRVLCKDDNNAPDDCSEKECDIDDTDNTDECEDEISDKETNSNQNINQKEDKVIKISENFLLTPGEDFANTFFDEFDTSEEDLMDYESMQEDEEFKQIFIINQDLENNLLPFARSINPYQAILCCREVLEKYDLILPDFNLDPSVDEWILDIELIDDCANLDLEDRNWFLHLEVLTNDDQSYIVFAGVVPN